MATALQHDCVHEHGDRHTFHRSASTQALTCTSRLGTPFPIKPCDRTPQAPVVASAVLVSAGHVLQWNGEIVKRWSNEIQEAVQSKVGMVQVRDL